MKFRSVFVALLIYLQTRSGIGLHGHLIVEWGLGVHGRIGLNNLARITIDKLETIGHFWRDSLIFTLIGHLLTLHWLQYWRSFAFVCPRVSNVVVAINWFCQNNLKMVTIESYDI